MSSKSGSHSKRPTLTIELGMRKERRKSPLSAAEEEIRQLLVQVRRRTGLSQEALAKRLDIFQAAVSRWESGHSSPSAAGFLAWMRACDATADELGLKSMAPSFDEFQEQLEAAKSGKLPRMDGDRNDYMGMGEAMKELWLSRASIYDQMAKGLQGYKNGHETVFKKEDIAALKKERERRKT